MPDLLKDRVAHNLRRLRQQLSDELGHEVTQADIAKRIGVSWKAYQRWESGTNLPRPETTEALAEAFGVNTADIYGMDATADMDELREKVDDMNRTLGQLVRTINVLVADGKATSETVQPSKVKALMDRHGVTLTRLSECNEWYLPDGRPDPTKAGREIGWYGSKPKPRDHIERLLVTVGIDPGELDEE